MKDAAEPISNELERARSLAFADDHAAARDLLLSLMPDIEEADRDDLMLEVFAQLGEIYLERTAFDGVRECLHRIRETLAIYDAILAGTAPAAVAAQVSMPHDAITAMCARYRHRADFLATCLAAGLGDHDGAATALAVLTGSADPVNADEHDYLTTLARIHCATALIDDDQHQRSSARWQDVIDALENQSSAVESDEAADHLLVFGALAYGRFCVETGRLAEAAPWLMRAGARAEARGWQLAISRAGLELGAASWAAGDYAGTERLITEAYPVIAEHARAHDVARCWLYRGLFGLAVGELEQADQYWEHAERHWRELGRPLHLHRILLQRSWIPIFYGRFPDAVELIAEARTCLDSSPRSSWLQYARLDDQLGTVYRAEALNDLGFDAAGDPSDSWEELEDKHLRSQGVINEPIGTPAYNRAMAALAQAAELKVPAALAVDSMRYSITDSAARTRWGSTIAAPLLAGAFAVVYEWENTALLSQLIEYHSARGAFAGGPAPQTADWTTTATAPTLLDGDPGGDLGSTHLPALVAAGSAPAGRSLTQLRPLPPLQMDPDDIPLLMHYRELAHSRYGRAVTSDEPVWRTWP